MRSPLQNGIRWDTTPLPGCPPLIDEDRDGYHIESCLKAGGFPRAVRVGESVVSVYPPGPEQEEAERIAAYLAGIKDRKPIYPDLSKRGTGRFR